MTTKPPPAVQIVGKALAILHNFLQYGFLRRNGFFKFGLLFGFPLLDGQSLFVHLSLLLRSNILHFFLRLFCLLRYIFQCHNGCPHRWAWVNIQRILPARQ